MKRAIGVCAVAIVDIIGFSMGGCRKSEHVIVHKPDSQCIQSNASLRGPVGRRFKMCYDSFEWHRSSTGCNSGLGMCLSNYESCWYWSWETPPCCNGSSVHSGSGELIYHKDSEDYCIIVSLSPYDSLTNLAALEERVLVMDYPHQIIDSSTLIKYTLTIDSGEYIYLPNVGLSIGGYMLPVTVDEE